jgi:benzoate-CoA ligase family protein
MPSSATLNIADEFIAKPARQHPNKTAVVGVTRQANYADLAHEVDRVAQALRDAGCHPGDRVLVVLPDSIEFIASFFGAAKIGALPVPVNSMAPPGDYHHFLTNCGARFAIVHSSIFPEIRAALAAAEVEEVIVVESRGYVEKLPGKRLVTWEDWQPQTSGEIETHPTSANDPAFLLYTSGSGGLPRAAVHRHGAMMAASEYMAQKTLGIRADDVIFSVSKLYFAYGLGAGMYFPLSVGASTVLFPDRPRADLIAEAVASHRPTVFFSVPTFYASLLREAETGKPIDFSSVRLAVSAGEPLPAGIFTRFRDRFGVEILDGIGSTEMLHMYIATRPGQARAGSCGVPVSGYEVKLVGDDEREVPDGEMGHAWVAGASRLLGYWNDPEDTRSRLQGNWFLTGDKLICDADGYYHYCGRSDDMMKVSGMWVSPADVENALLGHPAVAECAVVGQSDGNGLLRPVAYIVLRPSVQQPGGGLESELDSWLRTRMVGYKCPATYHFIPELPKTATGKIQRYLLRCGAARNPAVNP